MLENLDKITKENVKEAYKKIISTSKKALSFVGDIDFEKAQEVLNKYLSDVENSEQGSKCISTPTLSESKKAELIKPDAQQAQIIQGWIVPTFSSEDYYPFMLLNIILGSAGLSSRLFLELREKQGLAYHVRSTYETNEKCANFSIYIATEPKNIQICLDGFEKEINKLKENLVDEVELENAKNNFIGKQQFLTETNAQQSNQLAYYGLMDLGFDFQQKTIEKIKKITPKQIQACAKMLDDKFVVSILRP